MSDRPTRASPSQIKSNGPVTYVDMAEGVVDPNLLQSFVNLYDETFTDPTEREDPLQWSQRLSGPKSLNPRTHLLVALASTDDPPDIIGGLMFEYYRESGCGLLTYLVVATRHRNRGVARELVSRARAILEQDAALAECSLEAVFAETEDPAQVDAGSTSMDPNRRLAALYGLGGRWIDIPYVQPELQRGIGRSRHLLLVAMCPTASAKESDSISGQVLRAFLDEYYRSLGVSNPAEDVDFAAMSKGIGRSLELKDLRERVCNV